MAGTGAMRRFPWPVVLPVVVWHFAQPASAENNWFWAAVARRVDSSSSVREFPAGGVSSLPPGPGASFSAGCLPAISPLR